MQDASLQEYVQQARSTGQTDEAIRAALSSIGWATADIDEALGVSIASAVSTTPTVKRRGSKVPIIVVSFGVVLVGAGVAAFLLYSKLKPPAPASLSIFSAEPADVLMNFGLVDGRGKQYGPLLSGSADLRSDDAETFNGTLRITDAPPVRLRFSTYIALAADKFYLSFRQSRQGGVPPADHLVDGGGTWAVASREDVRAELAQIAPELVEPASPWISLTPTQLRELQQAVSESDIITGMSATDHDAAQGRTLYSAAIDPQKFQAFAAKAYRIVIGREPDAAAQAKIASTAAHLAKESVIVWVDDARKDIVRIGAMPAEGADPSYQGLDNFDVIWQPLTKPSDQSYRSATATLGTFIR
jgi:hypothetical protein